MVFKEYKTKKSIVLIYTGDGKGKTSASLGLLCRALGADLRVAYFQFIKSWEVNEHKFIKTIAPIYKDKLLFYKGGSGFYKAGELSDKNITDEQHKKTALRTYDKALAATKSGDYDLVICDEINNAVHDGLLSQQQLQTIITSRNNKTSICLTGRNFPKLLLPLVDIATNMTKLKHHFDDKFLANPGIDY